MEATPKRPFATRRSLARIACAVVAMGVEVSCATEGVLDLTPTSADGGLDAPPVGETGGTPAGQGGNILYGGSSAVDGAASPDCGGCGVGSGGGVGGSGVSGAGGTVSSGGTSGGGGIVSSGGIDGAGGIVSTGGIDGAGGVASTGGAGGMGGIGPGGGLGGGPPRGGQPKLPIAHQACPKFTNGGTVQIVRANGSSVPVDIYMDPNAKSKPSPGGALVVYWHSTGAKPSEVHAGFGDQNIAAVTAAGGVVAAPTSTVCLACITTDDLVWFVEDDFVLDTIVACAVEQANIDVGHIHTLGFSAGALHSVHVGLARSNYVASIISHSGGFLLPVTAEDTSNRISALMAYGDSGADVFIIDFNVQSHLYYGAYQPQGYYTMMCHHPGGHAIDTGVVPHSLEFFMAHPFKVSPEPYAAGIPGSFPSYCSNSAN